VALSHLLDARFRIPGTTWRYGLDGVIGLVPGIGDAASLGMSGWIVWQSYLLGARKRTLGRMVANMLVDSVVGSVPIAGDVFDFAYKANRRNIKLLSEDIGRSLDSDHRA
jgi:hypothetical protein